MSRWVAYAAAIAAAVYVLRLWNRADTGPVDEMAQPFLVSRNSATYFYNATTGGVTSYD